MVEVPKTSDEGCEGRDSGGDPALSADFEGELHPDRQEAQLSPKIVFVGFGVLGLQRRAGISLGTGRRAPFLLDGLGGPLRGVSLPGVVFALLAAGGRVLFAHGVSLPGATRHVSDALK